MSSKLILSLTVLRKHSDTHDRYLLARLRTLGFRAYHTRLPAEGVGTIEQLNVQRSGARLYHSFFHITYNIFIAEGTILFLKQDSGFDLL
jgi:hypothetical protein